MEWTQEFPAAITVCDAEGIILSMNARSVDTFSADGGERLIGSNLLDCHPEPARSKVADMLRSQQRNVYTIEKAGVKKLIYQSPWFDNGIFAGIVELSLPLPDELPHFDRNIEQK
jgi:transcriptional regulator with PAS, ATPase and Fis domain